MGVQSALLSMLGSIEKVNYAAKASQFVTGQAAQTTAIKESTEVAGKSVKAMEKQNMKVQKLYEGYLSAIQGGNSPEARKIYSKQQREQMVKSLEDINKIDISKSKVSTKIATPEDMGKFPEPKKGK